jgi:GGDEF domain-containing protein
MSNNNFINSIFRPEVLALSAYHVADATGFIKLDAMENPYSWSDEVKQQWLAVLKDCALNRYPDPEAEGITCTVSLGVKMLDHNDHTIDEAVKRADDAMYKAKDSGRNCVV